MLFSFLLLRLYVCVFFFFKDKKQIGQTMSMNGGAFIYNYYYSIVRIHEYLNDSEC